MFRRVNNNKFGVIEYAIDSEEDLDKLPKEDTNNTVYAILRKDEKKLVYLYSKEIKDYILINGDLEEINAELENINASLDNNTNSLKSISLKNFGCKCDGVTDDTMSFINAINTSSNINLMFDGTLRITAPIKLVENQRINISGVSNGRKNKSVILFDCSDKNAALFTTDSVNRINTFFGLNDLTIKVKKNNKKSVNTVFSGLKIQESTINNCSFENFNKIFSNCGASWITKITNSTFSEIGRAFMSDDCLFVDNIITNNYFSGNSSMPFNEDGVTVVRCPDFMDTTDGLSRISKTNISNNWFEKFGTVFTHCSQCPVTSNNFDFIYTLGKISTVFSSNVLCNFDHSSFLQQFKNYGNVWSGFNETSYIAELDSNACIVGNQFFFDIKEGSIKGYKFRNYGSISSTNKFNFNNIKISNNTYGLSGYIDKNLFLDFSNVYFTYFDDANVKLNHLKNIEIKDYELIPFENIPEQDDYKFYDNMKFKYKDMELECKIKNQTLPNWADVTTNICRLYDSNGDLYFYKTENLCGGFDNISTDKTGVNCKWYLQNSGMVKQSGSSDINLNLIINNNSGSINRSIYCNVSLNGGDYYRFSPCKGSSLVGNTVITFYDVNDNIVNTAQLTSEIVVKLPSNIVRCVVQQQIKFTGTNIEWVTPSSINKYGNSIGNIVYGEKIKLLQVLKDDGSFKYYAFN